jgi:hypothetical protein
MYFEISLAFSGFILYNGYRLIKPVLENYYVTLENGPSIKNYGIYLDT